MKRNLKRALAALSAMAMLAPVVDLPSRPFGAMLKASAETTTDEVTDPTKGTLEVIGSSNCRGTVTYSLDNATAKATLSELSYAGIGTESWESGRDVEGYWFGVKINAPEFVNTKLNGTNEVIAATKLQYKFWDYEEDEWEAGEFKNFKDALDTKGKRGPELKHYCSFWGSANYDKIMNSTDPDGLKYKMGVDWDGDDDIEQTFEIVIPSTDVLTYNAIPTNGATDGDAYIHVMTNKHRAVVKKDGTKKYNLGLTTGDGKGHAGGNIVCKLDGENVYTVSGAPESHFTIGNAVLTADKTATSDIALERVMATTEEDESIKFTYYGKLVAKPGFGLPSAITVTRKAKDGSGAVDLVEMKDYIYSSNDGSLTILNNAFSLVQDSINGDATTRGKILEVGDQIIISAKETDVNNSYGVIGAKNDAAEVISPKYSSDNQTIDVIVNPLAGNVLTYNNNAEAANVDEACEGYVHKLTVKAPTTGTLKKVKDKVTVNGKEWKLSDDGVAVGTLAFASGDLELKTLITNELIQKGKIAGKKYDSEDPNSVYAPVKYEIDWNNDKTVDLTLNLMYNCAGMITAMGDSVDTTGHTCGQYREGNTIKLGYIIDSTGGIACKTCDQTPNNELCRSLATTGTTNCTIESKIVDRNTKNFAFNYVLTIKPNDSSYRLPETVVLKNGSGSTTELKDGTHYVYDKTAGTITISSENLSLYFTNGVYAKVNCVAEASLDNISLSVGGDIGINIYASLSSTEKPEDYAVKATFNGKETLYPFKGAYSEKRKAYIFTIPVAAKEMTDVATVQVFKGAKKNVESGRAVDVSVKDYAERLLTAMKTNADSKQARLEKLIQRMLNYGAASQINFNYLPQYLADSGLENLYGTPGLLGQTETAKSIKTSGYTDTIKTAAGTIPSIAKTTVGKELTGLKYHGSSLSLKSETVLRYYFTLTGSAKISDYTFTLSRGELSANGKPVPSGSGYYIEVANIPAQSLGDAITLTVSDGANSVKYLGSAINYCAGVIADGTQGEKLELVARTMYLYSLAAADYLED